MTTKLQTSQGGTGTSGYLADYALKTSASGAIISSDVTAQELEFLSGVTSNVQDQLNSKLETAPVDSVNGQTGVVVLDADDISDAATVNKFTNAADISKLAGIEAGAEVNNISDTDATDLTDGGNTTLHNHDSRYYTESETDTLLSAKQDTLISASNIKTINGNSILGSGNLDISGGGGVSDGDKGQIVVSNSGATWKVKTSVLITQNLLFR